MKAAVLQLLRVAECSLSSDGERIPHGKSLFFFVATPSSRAQPFLPKPCNEGSQARAIFFFSALNSDAATSLLQTAANFIAQKCRRAAGRV